MIKGVNLGNWLVLEKWMSPELFAGTDAEDETHLCTQLSRLPLIEQLTLGTEPT
jgi:glucan 1,3-beta-glucosidase